MTRLRLGLSLLAVLILGAASCVMVDRYYAHKIQAAEKLATELQAVSRAALKRANEEESKRVQVEAYIKEAESRVDTARSKVTRHGNQAAVAALPSEALRGLVNDQNALIAAQDERDALKERKIASLEAENKALRESLEASSKRGDTLADVVRKMPENRPWAVGVLYGTDRSVGAWVERDLGRVRVGADVVRRPAGMTGRFTLEATARLGIRF